MEPNSMRVPVMGMYSRIENKEIKIRKRIIKLVKTTNGIDYEKDPIGN